MWATHTNNIISMLLVSGPTSLGPMFPLATMAGAITGTTDTVGTDTTEVIMAATMEATTVTIMTTGMVMVGITEATMAASGTAGAVGG